jgi:hypothetical protein
MDEILPGLWTWPTLHPRHGIRVSSYYDEPGGVVVDPFVPAEGLRWFDGRTPPALALLTNRHHLRDSLRFRERFGTRVLCNRLGVMEFTRGEPVEYFGAGDTLPGDVVALEVGVICPDETALHLTRHRAVAVADGVIREPHDGPLAFVPDMLMHDPPRTRAGLAAAFLRIADTVDFDHLLLAHGDPVIGDGREALRRFAEGA